MRLQGKIAVVTGAGRGIGLAIVEAFLREGACAVLADIDARTLHEASESLGPAMEDRIETVVTDVSSSADCATLMKRAEDRFGRVDILVCNAGIVRPSAPIEDIEEETWNRVIGINLMGCIHPTRFFVPGAKARGSGRIIYMASVAGQVGGVSAEVTYSVTKAAVLCLSKSVAKQLGPFGITVNAIAPGTIRTAMTDVLQYDASVMRSIPLGQIGTVADIAAAAVYLASDEAGYVTGSTLDVNGGISMR